MHRGCMQRAMCSAGGLAHAVGLGIALLAAAACNQRTERLAREAGAAVLLPERACTLRRARRIAPEGMEIGPIDNLNPALPPTAAGVTLVPASGNVPAYCLLTGSVVTNPETGKTASFGFALPLHWNRKFLFSGCGGFCGVVFQTAPHDAQGGGYPHDALEKGYAIAATDGGHQRESPGAIFDAAWALEESGEANADALTDFHHRAVHVVTREGQRFVRTWYEHDLKRSYFVGCSEGGREAMVEAARYPTDFDGYLTGAPFFDIPGQVLAGRAARVLLDAPDAYIPPERLTLVDNAIHEHCDALDGTQDNLIQDPGACSFYPRSLLCEQEDRDNCLTQNQVDTLLAWLTAARDEQGRVASLGFPVSDLYNDGARGGNLFAWAEGAGPPQDIDAADPWGSHIEKQPPAWALYDQSFKYLVFRDPQRDNNEHAPVTSGGIVAEEALALLEARTAAGRADDPSKLAPFLEADRKMIIYHGYSDGFINPFRTIRFYQDWAALAGGYEALKQNARLFMAPGMYHCNKGPGPNVFDALGALEQWVEHGDAPDAIIATKYANDDLTQRVERTMPLCTYPTRASYEGYGDVNSAENWSCTENQALLRIGLNGEMAGLGRALR